MASSDRRRPHTAFDFYRYDHPFEDDCAGPPYTVHMPSHYERPSSRLEAETQTELQVQFPSMMPSRKNMYGRPLTTDDVRYVRPIREEDQQIFTRKPKTMSTPAPPMNRSGRCGSTWRHVNSCINNAGSHLCWIDGTVKQTENKFYPPKGLDHVYLEPHNPRNVIYADPRYFSMSPRVVQMRPKTAHHLGTTSPRQLISRQGDTYLGSQFHAMNPYSDHQPIVSDNVYLYNQQTPVSGRGTYIRPPSPVGGDTYFQQMASHHNPYIQRASVPGSIYEYKAPDDDSTKHRQRQQQSKRSNSFHTRAKAGFKYWYQDKKPIDLANRFKMPAKQLAY